MNTLPVPENENERLRALRDYHILDTPGDAEFDRLAELASLICDAPVSMVSFMDSNRQWIKSGSGIEVKEAARDLSFCQYTILDNSILEVEDVSKDLRFKDSPYVTGDPHFRFYAGYPIVDPQGCALGTICVLDTKPKVLTDAQRKSLRMIAEQAVSLTINQRKKKEQKHFERLFELSNDLICIVGLDGHFKKVNPAFREVLGWEKDELLGKSVYEFIHPDHFGNVYLEIERLRAGDSVINFFQPFKKKGGGYVTLQWVAAPEPGTDNLFAIARNVTEEKINEEKLRISEEKFRTFFDNSQGLLCTHDLEGNFLAVNSVGAGLLGYSSNEALKLNLKELIPVEFHASVNSYLTEIVTTGKSNGLMTTEDRNGARRVWRYNNILFRDRDGSEYVIGNSIDVTQSHQLEKNLRRMQEMLLQTNEMAKVGGWEVDIVHNRVYWSEVTRQIHQVDPYFEPQLESALNFYREGESREKIKNAVRTAILQGGNYDLELEMITVRGEKLWVRTVGYSDFENGVCKRIYGTLQDIDQKKKSEQDLITERARLLAFVQHAPAAVAMFDTEIRYLAFSNRWLEEYRLMGRDIIGLSHYEVFPNVSQEWKDIHKRCLEGAVMTNEEERWHPEGWDHDQFLKWEVRPWYQFDGTVGGIMMFTQDITEAALSKEELKEAKLQSEQANLAKSEFLANMSHEIRTPLNGVIGFTDLVLKTKMTDTQKQYLGIVNQSANALLGIINDILDFSKIEAGKLELDVEKCDIYDIASQSADIISFPIQSKGLEMLLNIPDDLPRFVWVDEIRLKQVLINLLSNAAKFTESGEIELKIEMLGYESNVQDVMTCRFVVRDTGIGIRHEKQGKIFEAFLQEDGSTTKKYGGTGLGLTISNKLLRMMGSELKLDSVSGVGSTFSFDLKMKCERGEPIRVATINSIKRVLIVDDNDNNLMILERMLYQLNIHSDQAKGGFQALNILGSKPDYDAVFMDYEMPDMDGLDTIRKIRQDLKIDAQKLPVVLLSSSGDESRVIRASEQFKISYRLKKPTTFDDIILCITRLSKDESGNSEHFVGEVENVSAASFVVLVAEDNLANMFLTRTIINKMAPNAKVLEARTGLEAVELCVQQLPDIIFMDVQMPEMNGYEATIAIKKLPGTASIPVIALTAGNVKGEREKCLEAGMADYVTKPFVQESIWQLLNRVPGFSNSGAPEREPEAVKELENAHFNVEKLRQAYFDDDAFIEEILTLTRDALQQNLADIRALNKTGDLDAIKAAGHRLKGVSRAVFLSGVTNIAEQLEHLGQYDQEHIGHLLNYLDQEIEYLLPLLHRNSLTK